MKNEEWVVNQNEDASPFPILSDGCGVFRVDTEGEDRKAETRLLSPM
jgi:hypothetical protein